MDGKIVIETEINTKNLDKQLSLLEDKLEGLIEEYEAIEKADPFDGQNDELIKIQNQIDATRKKITKLKTEQKKVDFSNWGSSIEKATKKIAKMTLAVFGIRSAYLFVRSAVNTIASQDEQLKADIDAIKIALAYTIEPLVRGIVNLMKTLMGYVAFIVKAWTGRDIFARSAKSLAGASKSAKELKKSSFSFDKFNKLGGGSDSSAGAGAGAGAGLQTPEDADVPKWIKWIAENKNLVIGALTGIALALLAIKLANPATLFVIALGLVVYLVAQIIKHWDEIKGLLKVVWDYIKAFFKGLLDTILSIIETALSVVNGIFTTLIEILKAPFVIAFETIKGVFNGIVTVIKGVFEVIKGIFIGDWQKVMDGFKQIFKGTFDSLWSIAKAPLNLIIDGINALLKGFNKIKIDIPSWIPKIGGKKFGINIPTIPRLAQGGIVHNPGSGVMMGSYIAGEGRNPEAVIPLDDATLDRLGQAIARHSQINATIVNEMDGRILSKNLARVYSENAFARNGGY